jgi:hypothetical protein
LEVKRTRLQSPQKTIGNRSDDADFSETIVEGIMQCGFDGRRRGQRAAATKYISQMSVVISVGDFFAA